MKAISKKLSLIQAEIKCGKTEYNAYGGFHHRNLDSIYEALKPLLAKHLCAYRIAEDEVVQVGDQYYRKGKACLTCIETGEELSVSCMTRETFDHKKMSNEQMSGTTASYNDKYMAGKMFLLDDAKDVDTMDNTKGKQFATPPAQTTGKNVGAKASDKQVKLAKFLRDKTGAKVSDAQIMSLDAANMSSFIDKLNAKKKELESGAITTSDIPFD